MATEREEDPRQQYMDTFFEGQIERHAQDVYEILRDCLANPALEYPLQTRDMYQYYIMKAWKRIHGEDT